jgi:hypothetical protein
VIYGGPERPGAVLLEKAHIVFNHVSTFSGAQGYVVVLEGSEHILIREVEMNAVV